MEPEHATEGMETHELQERFVGHIAEKLADSANARAAFGEPVQHDGTTVIPVATVRYGFGGGIGRKASRGQEGAAGGVQVTPLGYIEMSGEKVKFRRIRSGSRALRVLVAALGAAFAVRGLLRMAERGRLRALVRSLPPGQRRRLARQWKTTHS